VRQVRQEKKKKKKKKEREVGSAPLAREKNTTTTTTSPAVFSHNTITPHTPHQLGSASVLHLRADDVHALALAPRASNANAMAGLATLSRAVAAIRAYCGGECTEAALRSNFVLILELLDEVADWGVPQVTDPAALKSYIFQRGLVGAALSAAGGLGGGSGSAAKRAAQAAAATLQVTGAVGWRAPGIKYKRNEVFLDVVETVNALVSSRGATLRAEVVGRVTMKAFLSGMPDVKLGLNDRVEVRSLEFFLAVFRWKKGGGKEPKKREKRRVALCTLCSLSSHPTKTHSLSFSNRTSPSTRASTWAASTPTGWRLSSRPTASLS
jgi:hypothetical protein